MFPESRILIFTHPGSRISDPKTVTKERGWKKLFFAATNLTKLKIILFWNADEKIGANLNYQRIKELFTQKIVTKLSNIWVWDPRSGIRKKRTGYSGSRIQGSKRYRIPDPQHWAEIPTLEQAVAMTRSNSLKKSAPFSLLFSLSATTST
jgi:hypothetical protein